jgi:hypothetical protein
MMKPFYLLPCIGLIALLALRPALSSAQNYNAGVGSGTGGYASTFVGTNAGHLTTGSSVFTGSYNSFVGYGAGYNNSSGSSNSFLGYLAGNRNTSGNENSFVGYQAGFANTTGNWNSFLGTYAGYRNNTGTSNSFVGFQAGYANTTGNYNSFLGNGAGNANTTGYNNSFVGTYAGSHNNTGNENSLVGYRAGFANTTGSANSFLGSYAGSANTTGVRNTVLGAYAANNNQTGSRNVVVGDSTALYATGSFNVYLGSEAGQGKSGANNLASNNVMIGARAGQVNATGDANLFIGHQAGLLNTSGNSNDFSGKDAGYSNTSGSSNTFLGRGAANKNTTGSSNIALGRDAGANNTTGSSNLFLGSSSNASAGNFSNAGAIGYRAYVSADNSLVLGSISGTNGATVSTKVGIGTTAPAYLLHVNGNAAKPGGGSWTVASDQRLKQDISEFRDGLEMVQKIKPVWFKYNGKAGLPKEKRYVGIIAQEMQKIAPYTVGEFTYTDTTGRQEQYLDYDANAVTYMLVNAMKELKTKTDEVAVLKQENQEIKQRLAKLEALLQPGSQATGTSAQLYQNEPNPTEGSTVIRYFLPQESTSAQLKVYSLTGVEVQSLELTQKGNGQVKLSVGQLAAGEYVYHLLVNGHPIASKKLMLER